MRSDLQTCLLTLVVAVCFNDYGRAQLFTATNVRMTRLPATTPELASAVERVPGQDPSFAWTELSLPNGSDPPHEVLPGPPANNGSPIDALFPPLDGEHTEAELGSVTDNALPAGHAAYGNTGYGAGLQWEFWGWLSYSRIPQQDFSSFWAYEFEVGVSRSITQQIAATAQIDFMDIPGREVFMEQLYLSFLLPNYQETILTVGKFNSPFGVEPRDFWNRVSASRSLLFRRQPQDLIGAMITHPIADKRIILRPMLVSGLVNTGFDNNEQPSLAMMVEFRPHEHFSLAGTYWHGPEMDQRVGDKLYFVDVQATWYLTQCLSLAGEYLQGATESDAGSLDWRGFLALTNWDWNEKFRMFAQYSLFDDRDGFQTGVAESRQQASIGFGWYIYSLVEVRGEYRHDDRPVTGDSENWDLHLTFGF